MTPEENRARVKAWNAANPQRVLSRVAAWKAANPEKVQAYRDAAKEKTRARRRRHYLLNKATYLARARIRELWERRAMPSWADAGAIAAVYAESARLTAETGVEHHVDHEIPLRGKTVCGLHVHTNLKVVPAADNLRKTNKFTA